jgi:O-antigen ligase
MFWIWLVALSFGQALLNRRLHLFWRIVLFGLVLATFYVAYFVAGDWKSGWVPPLVVIVTIIGVRYWRRLIYLAPLSILPAALLARQVIDADQYSYSTRLEAWQIVLEIAKANPITGLGFANYYWYTPLYKIRGWSVQFNSHSQYVDIIAQMGIIGLAIFLWLFWEIGRLGWWLRDRVPGGFAQGYVYGALGGLAGTLMAAALADWLLPFAYNIGFSGFRSSILAWIFLGGLVSLEKIVPSQEHI